MFTEPIAVHSNPGTTAGVFLERARRLATRPFVHYHRHGGWQDVSWIEMQENALRIASGLVAAGVDMGDRVLLLSENRVEWIASHLGIQVAGATTVPLDPGSNAPTPQTIAGRSSAILAIASGEAQAARLHLTDTLGQIVRMDGEVARWLRSAYEPGLYEEVERRLSRLGPDDASAVTYTAEGGGPPTEAVVTHRGFVEMAESRVHALDIGENDVALSLLDPADPDAGLPNVFAAIAAGATVWMSRDEDLLVEDVHSARPTLLFAASGAIERIHDRAVDEATGRSTLRRGAAAWALWVGRERAVEGRTGPWTRIRHALADRMVLASARHRAGGGRLRFLVTTRDLPRQEVVEYFAAIGLPVLRAMERAPGQDPTPLAGGGR
jgi:long-chain acyl-CoA synthetase